MCIPRLQKSHQECHKEHHTQTTRSDTRMHSKATEVTSRVPQGTFLRPLLFLVYINDMPETISSTARLFADDSFVYRIVRTEEDQALLQEDLDKLQKWERDWLMQFNPDKCEVIRITNKRYLLINKYCVHDTELLSFKDTKYLKVTVSSDLSWSKHVENTIKKATTSLNFLKRNLHGCPTGVKDQCYKSLVRPILEYSSCVWDPHTQRNVKKLAMVQGKAARFVKGDYKRTSSVTSMLTELHWNTLQERRMQSNKVAKIRNRYNQVPHLTQDTNGKVTNSQETPQTRAKRSALSQQVTTKHI